MLWSSKCIECGSFGSWEHNTKWIRSKKSLHPLYYNRRLHIIVIKTISEMTHSVIFLIFDQCIMLHGLFQCAKIVALYNDKKDWSTFRSGMVRTLGIHKRCKCKNFNFEGFRWIEKIKIKVLLLISNDHPLFML